MLSMLRMIRTCESLRLPLLNAAAMRRLFPSFAVLEALRRRDAPLCFAPLTMTQRPAMIPPAAPELRATAEDLSRRVAALEAKVLP